MNDKKGTTENSFKVGDKVRVLPHKSGWIEAGEEGVVERVLPANKGITFPVYVVFEGDQSTFRADELELIVPEPVNHDPKIALLEGILATLERIETGGRYLVRPVEENPGDPQNLEPKAGDSGVYFYEKTNVYINKRRAYLRTGFYQKED